MAVVKTWNATALTGGAVRALDAIPTASLTDGDRAFIALSGILYYHKFNASATDAEDSPQKIRPDDYTTAGVWEIQQIYGTRQNLAASATITVGGGGDYATLNEAVEAAVNTYMPEYINTGVTLTINLLTGFALAEQVLVFGLNLGWITITGDDAETSITRSALTIAFDGTSIYPAFGVTNGGVLPKISQLFRMDTSGTASLRNGVMVNGASTAIFGNTGTPGVADAAATGIELRDNSRAVVSNCDFSGAGSNGIDAGNASSVHAVACDVSGAGAYGVSSLSSYVDATSVNASTAVTFGFIVVNGGSINASSASGTVAQTVNTLTGEGIIFS